MKRFVIVGSALLWIVGLNASLAAADGKALFDKSCASCHGPGGKGDGPAAKAMKNKPPDFATLKGKSDAELSATIKDGTVGGKPGHPKGSKLSDDDVKALVEYVKQLGK